MTDTTHRLVGAVLPERDSASRAAARLHALGFAADDLQTAVWRDNRYVVESHVPGRLGRSVLLWALISAVLGGIVGALSLLLVFPNSAAAGAIVWGALIGLGLGLVLGAYWGISTHEEELWNERDWGDVRLGPGEVLLALEADGPDRNRVVAILEECGGREVKPVHPH
jgi:hypothetical protein